MKCPICKGRLEAPLADEELICQDGCGAAFGLEYLGYYKEGSNDRIEDGYEESEWKEKWKSGQRN